MHRSLVLLLLFAVAVGADLAIAQCSRASSFDDGYSFMDLTPAERKKVERQQRRISIAVGTIVGSVVVIIIGLNSFEKRKARQKWIQAQMERMQKGLL
jgi:hypothetical protein